MQQLRRRLASCALALAVFQMALLVAAPLAACGGSRVSASAEAEKECCPAGSHPPGECPLHARSKSASKSACRLHCDAPHGVGYLLGAIGVMPSPVALSVPVIQAHRFSASAIAPTLRTAIPDSPPPRRL